MVGYLYNNCKHHRKTTPAPPSSTQQDQFWCFDSSTSEVANNDEKRRQSGLLIFTHQLQGTFIFRISANDIRSPISHFIQQYPLSGCQSSQWDKWTFIFHRKSHNDGCCNSAFPEDAEPADISQKRRLRVSRLS